MYYSAYANNIINNQLQASTVFFVILAVSMIVIDKYLLLKMDLLSKYLLNVAYIVLLLISFLIFIEDDVPL